jgi:TNF receptor-associated protein 1
MSQTHEFQAEVKQVLDIVIHSLYTDREIFIRELVSNAADAMEKMRLTQLTEKDIFDASAELQISITTDEAARTLTIADSGIGMTRAELVENLGTIAHSGSKAFAAALKNAGKQNDAQLIGQFGVGFYSAFMVADKVEVHTHSWRNDGEHLVWTSDGSTSYTIDESADQARGCKIVLHLKEDAADFTKQHTVKQIIEKHSNFVSFPLLLNGERVNTVEALWLKSKDGITDEQYKEFYKFTAHAFDDPATACTSRPSRPSPSTRCSSRPRRTWKPTAWARWSRTSASTAKKSSSTRNHANCCRNGCASSVASSTAKICR